MILFKKIINGISLFTIYETNWRAIMHRYLCPNSNECLRVFKSYNFAFEKKAWCNFWPYMDWYWFIFTVQYNF